MASLLNLIGRTEERPKEREEEKKNAIAWKKKTFTIKISVRRVN